MKSIRPKPSPTDDELLAALATRLDERRAALQQSAELLEDMRTVAARLHEAEGMKGRFLSNIRNEINNPMTVLRGFASAIAGDSTLSREQICEMAAIIQREASSMSFKMQNIFAAADIEAGELDHTRSQICVNDLIADALTEMESFASEKTVAVILDIPTPVDALTDVPKLALIVTNLLHNAIEFARSTVTVRLQGAGEIVSINILDDGPGIPEENRKLIFDRFVQLSVGSTRQHPGNGLGLSVSRAFAEAIGASLQVATSPDGQTNFRLDFPVGAISEVEEEEEGANQFLFDALEAF